MLPDEGKTKEQLINELAGLRQRVSELETLETERKRVEEALRESEEKYRSLFESMLNGFAYCKILVDKNNKPIDFVHLEVNSAWERLIGLKKEDVIGKKITEVIPGIKESETDLISIYGKVALTGKATNFELYFEPLGKWFTISVYSPQKGYFVAVFDNITERKRAAEALRGSETSYKGLAESIADVFFAFNEELRYTYWNKASEELTGVSAEDALGKHLYDLFPDNEMTRMAEQMYLKALTTKQPQHFVNECQLGGKDFVFEISAYPSKGGLSVFVKDITERKQAEEELRESEERYRALMNLGGSVGEAIVMLQDNEQGNAIHTFVSDEWPRITGYSRKELLGMSFSDLLHPRDREASLARHKKRMSGEIIPGLFEMSIIRKDGTEVPIEVTSAYTTYKGERANVAFIRDITERKRMEEREKELQKELNLSSRLASVGELAAGVAHEINNPLTGILGFSERLMKRSTSQEINRDLARIHSEAQRAAKVVENLRTFARRQPPKKEYLDINETLARTLELRAYELRTGNIELTVRLTPHLPKIIGDFGQIQQVFLNIILNAEQVMTEANGEGKFTIKTQKGKGYIRVSFDDDGPGIPAEHLDKLFDPFFTTRGEQGGTGLGLSACHGIVAEHGGKIYAKSQPGKGATFFVELPVAPEEIDESEVAEEEPVRSRR